jgi:hypothetical protein
LAVAIPTLSSIWRGTLVCAAAAALVVGCGDGGLLDGLGERSEDVVRGSTTTSTTILVVDDEQEFTSIDATDVSWWNDDIEKQVEGDSSFVITRIFQRGDRVTKFVQASRLEIAAALPDIRFPGLVPADVGWVTSQLVFDVISGQLDPETAAAFGLWTVEPYTVNEGRAAILRIGFATDADLQSLEIRPEPVDEGLSLIWATGKYRYELFCRTALPEELCWQMAESARRLDRQLPPGADVSAAAP